MEEKEKLIQKLKQKLIQEKNIAIHLRDEMEEIATVGNYGKIIRKRVPRIKWGLEKNFYPIEDKVTLYNILLNTNELLSDVWADKIEYDEAGNAILTFLMENFKNNGKQYSYMSHGFSVFPLCEGVNENGQIVVPPVYSGLEFGEENTFIAERTIITELTAHSHESKTYYGFISIRDGRYISPIAFERVYPFSNGRALVLVKDFYKYAPHNGNIQSFSSNYFHNDKINFKNSFFNLSMYGYLDRDKIMTDIYDERQYAIPPIFEEGKSFDNEVAYVKIDGITRRIDKYGQETSNTRTKTKIVK